MNKDLPEPAVPMMNAIGMMCFFSCLKGCGFDVLTFMLLVRVYGKVKRGHLDNLCYQAG